MTTVNAVLLIPLDITASMIETGTSIPVVDTGAGEVAWDATPVVTGDRRNHVGSIWEALKGSTNVEPGTDATAWLRVGPSNRMAPFDDELNTSAKRLGDITYVLRPGFFTGLGIWGIVGDHLNIKIYDEPDGEIVEEYDGDLWEQAAGLYELLFMPLARSTQHYMENLPLYPDAEVHISITAGPTTLVQVALITLGHWDTLVGSGDWGGTQYDATAEIKTYSYFKRNDDGTVERKRRGSANNVTCTAIVPADQGNHAAEMLHKVQGRPVAFIASGLQTYEYLNGFGDVSGTVTASGPNHALVNLRIEGTVQEPK